MSKEPITWDQIEDLVFQLKQVGEAARKAAATLTRYQVKPTNRIKTLKAQSHELHRATSKANKSLQQYIDQLRYQLRQDADSENHSGAFPSGAPDQPRRDSEVSQ